eukprot:s697_g20.t1
MCFFVFAGVCYPQVFFAGKRPAAAFLFRSRTLAMDLTGANVPQAAETGFETVEKNPDLVTSPKPEEAASEPTAMAESKDTAADGQGARDETAQIASVSEQPLVAVDDDQKEEDQASEPTQVKCRRCHAMVAQEEAVEHPKFRPELRWTCRSCHACQTTLSRHGIQLNTLLSESEAVAVFAEAKAVRENSCDSRLSYSAARGMLKQAMIESSSREDRCGDFGEYQPLSYWQLRGYNVEAIEQLADCKTHPILGETYRVDITKKSTEFIAKLTEERIVRMETDFRQRAGAAAAAGSQQPAPAPLQLDLPEAAPEPIPRVGKKRKTEEEKQQDKEAAKAAKQAARKRQRLEQVAVAAAGKHLPALQKLLAKLDDASKKAESMMVAVPADVTENVATARAAMDLAISNCTKMLKGAAAGAGLATMAQESLLTDKKTQEILKKGNDAVRSMQGLTKVNKEPSAKAKASGGKAKGKK